MKKEQTETATATRCSDRAHADDSELDNFKIIKDQFDLIPTHPVEGHRHQHRTKVNYTKAHQMANNQLARQRPDLIEFCVNLKQFSLHRDTSEASKYSEQNILASHLFSLFSDSRVCRLVTCAHDFSTEQAGEVNLQNGSELHTTEHIWVDE